MQLITFEWRLILSFFFSHKFVTSVYKKIEQKKLKFATRKKQKGEPQVSYTFVQNLSLNYKSLWK